MITQFTLGKKEQKKVKKFLKKHKDCTEQYYIFEDITGVGVGFGMSCICGKAKDMTDYSKLEGLTSP